MNTQRNDFTYHLLLDAGIEPNMRVLDVGCGSGEVTMLISNLVGDNGEVLGFDVNERAIEIAEKSFKDEKIFNAHFLLAEIEDLPKNIGKFDAIVGRRVLMYQPDSVTSIKSLLPYLKPDGIMIFQESDSICLDLVDKSMDLHKKAQRWIWDTIAKEGGNIHMGLNLYACFKESALKVKGIKSEVILQTIESGSDFAWLIKMMLERITKSKTASLEEIDIDTLEVRLQNELKKSKMPFARDIAFGAWATFKN